MSADHNSDSEHLPHDNDDLTPQNAGTKLPTEQLTSFSRKKSFEVQDDKHEDLLDDDEFLNLEKQISHQQQQNQQLDQFAQEETKSRRSENQSMKGVSYATSDTEENKSQYDPQPAVAERKLTKKRLSRVEEELKTVNNPLRETLSEYSPQLNKSNATSMKETKGSKQKDQSKQSNNTTHRKKKGGDNVSQTGHNTQGTHKSHETSKRHSKAQHQHDHSVQSQVAKSQANPLELMNAQAQLMQQNPWMQMMMYQNMMAMQPGAQFPMNPLQQQQQLLMMQQQMSQSQQNPFLPMNPFMMPQMYNSNYQSATQPLVSQPDNSLQMSQTIQKMKESGQLPPQLQELVNMQEQLNKQIEAIQNENQILQQEVQKSNEQQDLVNESLSQKIEQRRQELQLERRQSQMTQHKSVVDEQNGSKVHENGSEPHLLIQHSEDQKTDMSQQKLDQSAQPHNEILDKTDENQVDGQQELVQQEVALNIQEPPTEQDMVLKEIALMAAQGHDPTAELEKENQELEEQYDAMKKQEREMLHRVTALEYENEILFGKSNSMDHSIQNYGKRLEELNKQIDELNAILRIKDHEMIEMTNAIHNYRMAKEAMRKEIMFRKQRSDQLENNLRKVQGDLERALFDQDDLNKTIDVDLQDSTITREENKRMKQTVDRLRSELSQDQSTHNSLKSEMSEINQRINEYESKMFSAKNMIDRLRNESEQTKVDLSYAKATTENQREAYEKLHQHYQKQLSINSQLDSQKSILMMNQNSLSAPIQISVPQSARYSVLEEAKPNFMDQSLVQEDRRVTFQNDHKRSSSQDNSLKQPRNFKRSKGEQEQPSRLNEISAHNSSRIKTILFDLSAPGNNETSSITGQKRRGGVVSQTREDGQATNRNFVHQMSNILSWGQNQGGVRARGQDESMTESKLQVRDKVPAGLNNSRVQNKNEVSMRKDVDLSYRERFSMPELDPNTSLRFGREQKHNASLNQSLVQQGDDNVGKPVKRDPAQINQMRDDLNSYQQRREKINAEINKISDKTRDGEEKRNKLEYEMSGLSKKIGELKMQLRKLDALKNNV